jgi:hypothetical protein
MYIYLHISNPYLQTLSTQTSPKIWCISNRLSLSGQMNHNNTWCPNLRQRQLRNKCRHSISSNNKLSNHLLSRP